MRRRLALSSNIVSPSWPKGRLSRPGEVEGHQFFPEGTEDFDCYVHPQAGLGIAIAVVSVLLGILVLFTSIVAITSLQARSTTDTTPTSSA